MVQSGAVVGEHGDRSGPGRRPDRAATGPGIGTARNSPEYPQLPLIAMEPAVMPAALAVAMLWTHFRLRALPAEVLASFEQMPDPPREPEFMTLDELKAEMKKLAWTKGDFTIVPYGFLWATTTYETELTVAGDYPLYVLPADRQGEDAWHVDAKSTRLGLNFSGPRIPLFWCAESGGKVEIDFQNNFVTENKGFLLLRHAYWEVKNEEFRLLAGQTWDVISPLMPGVLMYSVGWGGGNIGYRRAQFRGERYWAFSDVLMATMQGSINADILSEANSVVGISGDHAGWPVLEGRVALTLGRGKGCRPIELGVSGHIGEQIYDFPAPNPRDDQAFRTWSVNADVRVPITERLGVQAEFFTGENLGAYLGGAVQGVDLNLRRSIRTTGGWVDLWYDWTPRLHSHFGYAIDDPFNQDVSTGRVYNAFLFANIALDVTKNFLIGLEFTDWKTHWAANRPGESARFEFVAKYGF